MKFNLSLTWYSPDLHNYYKEKFLKKYLSKIKDTEKIFSENNIVAEANRWLLDLKWKIPVAGMMFDDVLNQKQKLDILEIGGSISWFTLELLKNHNYQLIEKAYTDSKINYNKVQKLAKKDFVVIDDWFNFKIEKNYDVIIANDIFPNVDQRLDFFIEKVIGNSTNIRILLTYFNDSFFEAEIKHSKETVIIKPWSILDIKRFIDDIYDKYDIVNNYEAVRNNIKYESLKHKIFTNHRNLLFLEINKV